MPSGHYGSHEDSLSPKVQHFGVFQPFSFLRYKISYLIR
jgi:hypothetical protein